MISLSGVCAYFGDQIDPVESSQLAEEPLRGGNVHDGDISPLRFGEPASFQETDDAEGEEAFPVANRDRITDLNPMASGERRRQQHRIGFHQFGKEGFRLLFVEAAADLILAEGTFLEEIDPHQEEDLSLRRGGSGHGEGGLDDRRDRSDVRGFSNLGDDGFIERTGAADDFEGGVSGDRIDRVAIGA
ncbi:MAG: hypothetical protein MPW16_16925 [Candidatus Manganitrophus sp.]|nr:MAG: hypothetical protein MPW16_16925 [Candidatus Manganitrophus sp.]